jgi:flagellar biosynthesis protein FlhF
MQVKVFEATDMRSAIEKVKKTLGPDALILSTRSLADERGGSGGRQGIEVTAAVDADMPEKTPSCDRRPAFDRVLETMESRPLSGGESQVPDYGMAAEFRQMKQSFEALSQKVALWGKRLDNGFSSVAGQGQDVFSSRLSGLGVSENVIDMLSASGLRHEDGFLAKDQGDETEVLASWIRDNIRIKNPLSAGAHGQKRIAFVGPTGVGKTTTIAKVAASALLHYGKKIALVTIDNYRIAAAEQLKIYGQIMDVSVELARSPGELAGIFSSHADKDLILVDTAGRSPRDDMRQREIAQYLDPGLGAEVHLVFSAPTGQKILETAVDKFAPFDPSGLVLTKLDECDTLGGILNTAVKARLPLSFLTNGQQVPEDLLVPEPGQIAEMILNPDEVITKWNTQDTRIRPEHCVN